jgi:hypothetical protein
MRRLTGIVLALTVLLGVGCAGSRPVVPRPDFELEDSRSFFASPPQPASLTEAVPPGQ